MVGKEQAAGTGGVSDRARQRSVLGRALEETSGGFHSTGQQSEKAFFLPASLFSSDCLLGTKSQGKVPVISHQQVSLGSLCDQETIA